MISCFAIGTYIYAIGTLAIFIQCGIFSVHRTMIEKIEFSL